jgi:hypothetical protein
MKKNDHSMKELVTAFRRLPAFRERLNLARIREFWRQEMGKTIGQGVDKIFIRDQKLYIVVRSSALRQELQMSKAAILTKMNQVIGEAYLSDVIVK